MPPTRLDDQPAAPSRRAAAPPATVTVVLVARDPHDTGRLLGSLLSQRRPPDRVVLVDASLDGLGDTDDLLDPVDDAGIEVLRTRIGTGTGSRRALQRVVEALPEAGQGRDLLWVLPSRAVPHPKSLDQLVAAARPGVGVAAPKLVDAEAPRRLVRFGIQATRAGRLVPDPRPDALDQGQYDELGGRDLLAAPLEGALLDRAVLVELGGHLARLGEIGADLDLGWGAQRAGHRVVGVPGARVALTPTAAEHRPSGAHRRQARRAAMAHASLPTRLLRGPWLALLTTLTALGLLLAKRPDLARDEISQLPAFLSPSSYRGTRTSPREVSRSHLDALFVTPATARQALADDLRGERGADGVDARSLEAERSGGWLTHPLPWLLLATLGMSAWAGRHITGEMRSRLDAGLVGGELTGGRATSAQLFDAWWSAWNGPGWGSAAEQSPAMLVLAGLAWLVEHVPGLGQVQSPAGLALAAFVVAALPLAALVTYLSARTLTDRRWLRAVVALAWVSTAPAAAAVGEGRIGPLLAIVLLPRIVAGLVRAGRPTGTVADAARTALWTALLATVLPVAGVAVVVLGLVWLLVGPVGRRGRGVTLALLPTLLLGPWLLTLQEQPRRLLAGWGATDTTTAAEPWRLALAQVPGAPHVWAWTAAILAVGVLALLVPGRRPLSWLCVLAAGLGLAWAVGAPYLTLGQRPVGSSDAGASITPWVGTGMLLVVGGALTAVLTAADVLPQRLRRERRALLLVPVLVLAVAAVGSAVTVAQESFGERLTTWREPRPTVAVDAAEGPGATRTLLVQRAEDGITYRLVGAEIGPLVRDLPTATAPTPAEQGVADVVAGLLGDGGTTGDAAGQVLAEQGIGYVVVTGPTEAERRVVDATPGLVRLGTSAGTTTWTVRPEGGGGQAPSRVRVVADGSPSAVDVSGGHGETDGDVPVGQGGRLVVAESLDWADHAEVTADGRSLDLDHRSATPAYELPQDADEVAVEVGVGHPWWKGLQGLALALALYLALPVGGRPRRPARTTDEERDA